MNALRAFSLILLVLGAALIATQSIWVPLFEGSVAQVQTTSGYTPKQQSALQTARAMSSGELKQTIIIQSQQLQSMHDRGAVNSDLLFSEYADLSEYFSRDRNDPEVNEDRTYLSKVFGTCWATTGMLDGCKQPQ